MLKISCFHSGIAEHTLRKTPCVMLVGGFDGLHAGHRELLKKAKAYGLPVGVMSLWGGKGKPLFTVREREEIFARAEIDFAFFLPFDEIKELSPKEFSAFLCELFCVRAFVCGEDFRFGKNASGDWKSLRKETGVETIALPLLSLSGEKIGSSVVKRALDKGDIPTANELLQEKFFLSGMVERDRGIGRTLSFPTANIGYPNEKYPLPYGVYETETMVGNKTYKGVTNFGSRPTFDDSKVVTETYLDGFSGDLYGKTLSVRFVRFLRDVVRFSNAEELKKQLREDVRRVQNND